MANLRVKIQQQNEKELLPNDLIALANLINFIEELLNMYIQYSPNFTRRGNDLSPKMRKQLIGEAKIKIGAINKNSPIDICLIIERAFIAEEIIKLIFSNCNKDKLIKFFEVHIIEKETTLNQKLQLMIFFTRWSKYLKIIKTLALTYQLNNC
jgi:hypothetical protein